MQNHHVPGKISTRKPHNRIFLPPYAIVINVPMKLVILHVNVLNNNREVKTVKILNRFLHHCKPRLNGAGS